MFDPRLFKAFCTAQYTYDFIKSILYLCGSSRPSTAVPTGGEIQEH